MELKSASKKCKKKINENSSDSIQNPQKENNVLKAPNFLEQKFKKDNLKYKQSEVSNSSPSSISKNEKMDSKNQVKSAKKERKTIKKITRKHPEFELTYDMMLGIRTTVSLTEASSQGSHLKNKISPFLTRKSIEYKFPKKGGKRTPAHIMNTFRFKDYKPELFQRIRKIFDVDPKDYLISLCSDFPYLEFVSNSNSGQFFFYSFDRRFMIKTESKRGCKFLLNILEPYVEHIEKNQNSLLVQFLGLHRVTRKNHRCVYFVIMSSIFESSRYIHEVYDLKGSKKGRSAKPEEINQEVPILKDNDFENRNVRIELGEEMREKFFAQLEKDLEFLVRMEIMDYSLLLGIHYSNNELEEKDKKETKELVEKDSKEKFKKKKFSNFMRQSIFALKKNHAVNSPYEKQFNPKEIIDPELKKKESKKQIGENCLFRNFCGGIRSKDKRKIYYLGVIDILQQFNMVKKIEYKYKNLKYKNKEFSAVGPVKYKKRLLKFLESHID